VIINPSLYGLIAQPGTACYQASCGQLERSPLTQKEESDRSRVRTPLIAKQLWHESLVEPILLLFFYSHTNL